MSAKPTKRGKRASRARATDAPDEQFVIVTAEQARAMPSRTDLARLDALTDDDIAAAVADDPDAAPIFTDEMFAQIAAAAQHRPPTGN